MSRTDDHTRPLLRSEICHQSLPISPWRSGRATVLQCSGYINQKIAAHSITRAAHTFSTLWGHSLPSYQQEEYPTSTLHTIATEKRVRVHTVEALPGCRWPAIILASWRCLVTSGLAWPRLNPAQLTVWVCSISISSSRGGG